MFSCANDCVVHAAVDPNKDETCSAGLAITTDGPLVCLISCHQRHFAIIFGVELCKVMHCHDHE